jgi:hypothetical protein
VRAVPWWIGRQTRLAILLACLLAALFALLSARTDVFSATTKGEQNPRRWCGYVPPALPSVPFSEVRKLRASLFPLIERLSPARYAFGPVAPEVVWSDNPPAAPSSRPPRGLWPASFEMRTWAQDPRLKGTFDDVVADVFLFADSRHAASFYTHAASARCHETGVARPASRPSGARLLTWVNPDAYLQDDLFLLSGTRVYRFSQVPPRQHNGRASSVEQQQALARIQSLACELPAPGTPTASLSCLPRGQAPRQASRSSAGRAARRGCVPGCR